MIIPPWAYLAGGALALTASFGAGWQVRAWKADSDELEQVTVVQQAIDAQRRVYDAAAGFLAAQRDQIDRQHYSTTTVIREAFNATPADPDCRAPDAVAGSLQQAVEGANRSAAGESAPAVRGAP